MEQLKFKNGLYQSIWNACLITVLALIFIFLTIMYYLFDLQKSVTNVVIIGAAVVVGIWIIAGLVILFSGTVIVNATEIKLCHGNTVKWCIQKNDVNKCIHNGAMKWWYFFLPVDMSNAFILSFNLKGKGLSRKINCSLSYKQVKSIKELFDYPIEIID